MTNPISKKVKSAIINKDKEKLDNEIYSFLGVNKDEGLIQNIGCLSSIDYKKSDTFCIFIDGPEVDDIGIVFNKENAHLAFNSGIKVPGNYFELIKPPEGFEDATVYPPMTIERKVYADGKCVATIPLAPKDAPEAVKDIQVTPAYVSNPLDRENAPKLFRKLVKFRKEFYNYVASVN